MAGTNIATTPPQAISWPAFFLTGTLSLVLGVIAIATPYAATSAINALLGGLLLIGGLSEIARAVRQRKDRGWWWALISGALYLVGGVFLLFDPLAGILALTVVLSIAFIFKGISAIVYAFGLRPQRHWDLLAASGGASITVGLLIWSGWPTSALWAIGLLVGIELVLFGLALIMLALAARAVR